MALREMINALPAIQTLTDIALSLNSDVDEETPVIKSEMVSFIRRNFKRKVCSNFIPAEEVAVEVLSEDLTDSQDQEDMVRCVCGSLRKDHDPNYVSLFESGEPYIFVEELKPTNAFGRIKFYPKSLSYRKPAEYVRLLDNTDPTTVLQLMCNHWCLTEPEPPSLVVSVAGGGSLYCLSDTQTRDIFNRGLVKAIRSTHGWLITFGLNSGVAKAVGAAVQEGQSLAWKNSDDLDSERSLHCIGIATWNQIQNHELLVNRNAEVLHSVDYYVDQVAREGEPECLNPNHSHFLLVDTGVCGDGQASMGTAEFRAALERQIAAPREDGGLDVPVVCLLVEGDMTSLEQLLNSVRQGLPAVVCEKSGRAADLIAWTLRQYSTIRECQDELRREQEEYDLRPLVVDKAREQDTEGRMSEPVYEQTADMIIEICTYYDQISLFRIGPNSSLDEAILLSILDSQHKRDPWKQLELAQRWNRADVASRILSDPRFSILATKRNVYRLMERLTESLIDNQVDFVKLYIDSGLPVKEYLTAGKLCEIYRKTVRGAPYLWNRLGLAAKGSSYSVKKLESLLFVENMTLANVNMLIHSFGRRFVQPEYQESHGVHGSKQQFSAPLQELFYWAVMLNRQELAVFFWEKSQSPLITAVAGTVLCHCLSYGEAHASLRLQFADFKEKLEDLAVGLTNEAFSQNVNKASLMIQRSSLTWGRLTCMQLAGLASDQKFLSTECCQYAIKKTWKRGYTASISRILFCMVTVLPVTSLIQFENELPRHCRCPPGLCTCKRKRFLTTDGKDKARANYATSTKVNDPLNHHHCELQPLGPSEFKKHSQSNEKKERARQWTKQMFTFYYSPAVKFINHTIWYVMFLLLYTYVVLFSLGHGDHISWPERFLYLWQITFIFEEIRIILWHPGDSFRDKLGDWWIFSTLQSWNRLHMVAYTFSLIIILMRLLMEKAFAITKMFLIINLLTYVMRIFKVYFINGYLGPKVVMINRMTRDLVMFLLVFSVFMMSYSVTYHAFFEPKEGFSLALVPKIMTHGIWEIFGEVDTSFFYNSTDVYCAKQDEMGYYINECMLRTIPMKVILAIYLFFSNILLVNMLIATFTHIFEDIHKNSEQVWKFEMYFLMEEYRTKPLLAEPLIFLEHLYLLFRHIVHSFKRSPTKITSSDEIIWGKPLSKFERYFLSVFERVCRADFLENRISRCSCSCGKCCQCGPNLGSYR